MIMCVKWLPVTKTYSQKKFNFSGETDFTSVALILNKYHAFHSNLHAAVQNLAILPKNDQQFMQNVPFLRMLLSKPLTQ